MKCSYARCKREAEIVLVLNDRRRGICKKHYKRILRHIERGIEGDGDYSLEDFIRVRGTSLFLKEKVKRKTEKQKYVEGRIEELKRITERLFV